MVKRGKKTTQKKHKRTCTRKRQHGGNYSSASTYGSWVNGSGDAQFDRVFGGDNTSNTNVLTPLSSTSQNMSGVPTSEQLSLVQSAGRRRKRKSASKKGRSKKGGFYDVIAQAIVPFGILGLQQTYKRKKNKN